MASIGIHTNGSQFYLALNPMPQLNGRCVAFARVVAGDESIDAIEKVRQPFSIIFLFFLFTVSSLNDIVRDI